MKKKLLIIPAPTESQITNSSSSSRSSIREPHAVHIDQGTTERLTKRQTHGPTENPADKRTGTPGSSKCHPWSLGERKRFLKGVLVVFDSMDVSRIHQGSYIPIFRSLPSWEVLHLLYVSRASSWSLRGRWWFLTGVVVVFDMVDGPRIHQVSYISIFRYLTS